jgi:hypothetical protein
MAQPRSASSDQDVAELRFGKPALAVRQADYEVSRGRGWWTAFGGRPCSQRIAWRNSRDLVCRPSARLSPLEEPPVLGPVGHDHRPSCTIPERNAPVERRLGALCTPQGRSHHRAGGMGAKAQQPVWLGVEVYSPGRGPKARSSYEHVQAGMQSESRTPMLRIRQRFISAEALEFRRGERSPGPT